MTNTLTKQRLKVSNEGTAGPYVWVPLSQLDDLTRLLESHRLYYWVEEHAISLNDEPPVALVDFGRQGDANTIQRILDSAP